MFRKAGGLNVPALQNSGIKLCRRHKYLIVVLILNKCELVDPVRLKAADVIRETRLIEQT